MKIQGPVEVEIKLHIINGEDEIHGEVTIGMGRGIYPTEEQLRARVEKFATEEMPAGYRLMSKQEFWNTLCMERAGTRLARPGGADYDA